MFRNVLVPMDFSNGARSALNLALDFLKTEGGYVELLHVVNFQAAADTVLAVDLVTPVLADSKKAMIELLAQLETSDNVAVSYTVQAGTPARVIVERAWPFDAIFMGTQGRSGLAKLLLGSVAQRVVQQAPCPVVTVRQEQEQEANDDRRWVTHALFEDMEASKSGLEKLQEGGVSLEDVSVIVRDDTHADDVDGLDKTKALEGTTAGGLIAGSVGGILGGMAGMGTVVSGGLGLMVLGPALAFGAVGGVVGGLLGQRVPGDKAKVLRAELEGGSVLIAVHGTGTDGETSAQAVLKNAGGELIDLD